MIKRLISKAKKRVVESDGFLTKAGALYNPVEWHSYGVGMIDGFMYPSEDYVDRLEKVREEVEDVDTEPHYFIKGWPIGQKLWLVLGATALLIMGLVILYATKTWD